VEYNVGYAPDDIGYLGMAKRVEIPPQRRLQACESNPQKVEGQIHISGVRVGLLESAG
jgi:hypothetical protein